MKNDAASAKKNVNKKIDDDLYELFRCGGIKSENPKLDYGNEVI